MFTPTLEPDAPLVSVIIPTYNRPDYLKEAIASVLQQSLQNFEIIVSDDCSDNNPQPLVEAFQDPRIRFRRNDKNLGIGWNSTYAFQGARGKYVASLNDDDIWHKDFLSTLVRPLEANLDLVIAFCDHYSMNADGVVNEAETEAQTRRWKRDQLTEGIYRDFWKIGLIDQSVYTASAAVLRRDRIPWERLSEAGVFWDYFIVYLACKSGGGAYYSPQRLSYYRVHAQSETLMSGGGRNIQAKIRKGRADVFCNECYVNEEHLSAYRSYFEKKWAQSCTTLGLGLLFDNQYTEARQYLFKAFKKQAFNPRTLSALLLSYVPQPVTQRLVTFRQS